MATVLLMLYVYSDMINQCGRSKTALERKMIRWILKFLKVDAGTMKRPLTHSELKSKLDAIRKEVYTDFQWADPGYGECVAKARLDLVDKIIKDIMEV